ncbi:MAG: cellulase family glycosylhydrolase, partial [Paludibacter sp.]
MNNIKKIILFGLFIANSYQTAFSQSTNEITVKGIGFEINGKPFEYTGISFFNALYNAEFNKNHETRLKYIKSFKEHGINVLRIWCQWDNLSGYIDSGKGKTLYNDNGSLKPELVSRLNEIITDANSKGVVVLLVLFARESWDVNIRLGDKPTEKAVESITKELLTHRNLIFQVWNEHNYRT